jgi:hypothetical protein
MFQEQFNSVSVEEKMYRKNQILCLETIYIIYRNRRETPQAVFDVYLTDLNNMTPLCVCVCVKPLLRENDYVFPYMYLLIKNVTASSRCHKCLSSEDSYLFSFYSSDRILTQSSI